MNIWSGLVDSSIAQQFASSSDESTKRAPDTWYTKPLSESASPLVVALEERREQLGVTCADFAAMLGLTRNQYYDIKAERIKMPRRVRLTAIALGVNAGVLL